MLTGRGGAAALIHTHYSNTLHATLLHLVFSWSLPISRTVSRFEERGVVEFKAKVKDHGFSRLWLDADRARSTISTLVGHPWWLLCLTKIQFLDIVLDVCT